MRFTRFAPPLAGLAGLALLAACGTRVVPPSAPPPAPAPAPSPTPAPTPTPVPSFSSWMDAPATPGDWSYANGVATFGQAGVARLTLSCANGAVRIAYQGSSAERLTFRTETISRAVAASAGVASLAARDPLLDAIAFSKGRFALEAGNETLYVPAYPEISRVIEDCR
jgi:hypothetical protein